MPAPPTCAREVALSAEVEAVNAAEEVEGVVDDARVKGSDAEAEAKAELTRVMDPDTEAEPDRDTDLEAHLGSEGFIEGRRLTTQTQNH